MIGAISVWAEQIIVAVILGTIIEMILPSGNNKKYIRAVIGVYVLFTILSPLFGKQEISMEIFNYDAYNMNNQMDEAMSESLLAQNDQSIEEIYLEQLKQDMKQKLREKGFLAKEIDIQIKAEEGAEYGRILGINLIILKIEEKKDALIKEEIQVNTIQEIQIGRSNTMNHTKEIQEEAKISLKEKEEIKEYLSGVYEVKKNKIKINENR